jgi:DNA-binding IclR family transcriptional regulator
VTRPAPAATRALAILDFLAAHPTESFTLSELARETGINLASAHAVLGAMTDAGYLVRHPTHKTYRLGPSTMAVGHAALASHPVIGVAREEMGRFAEETGLECYASAPLEHELVVVARVGRPAARPLVEVGQRLPLVPPLGIMFVAWSPPERIDAWLARVGTRAADEAPHHLRALESARALGYTVGYVAGGRQATVSHRADHPEQLDVEATALYEITYIAASTFDHHGDVSLVINAAGFDQPRPGEEIVRLGNRMRTMALAITGAVHGQPPDFVG